MAHQGARIEKPDALSVIDGDAAWLVEGDWSVVREITVHLPTALRSEPAPADAAVLLRGHDLLAAHRVPTNDWLMDPLPGTRPIVLWNAALPAENGRIVVPASLDADADPNRPGQWHRLELAPLRSLTDQPHKAAWFSFRLQRATSEQIANLISAVR